jgi:hypothetical protein
MAKRVRAVDLVKERLELYLSNPLLVQKQNGWTKEQYENEVALLENQILMSKRGKSSRNKGANYERTIAKIFKDKLGIELKRTPMSGGFARSAEKADEYRGDIVCLDVDKEFTLHLECKDHKSWSLPAWLRQAEEDCPKNKIPIVVMHRRQLITEGKVTQKVGEYVTLPLEAFLDIVDKNKVVITKSNKKVLKKKVKK